MPFSCPWWQLCLPFLVAPCNRTKRRHLKHVYRAETLLFSTIQIFFLAPIALSYLCSRCKLLLILWNDKQIIGFFRTNAVLCVFVPLSPANCMIFSFSQRYCICHRPQQILLLRYALYVFPQRPSILYLFHDMCRVHWVLWCQASLLYASAFPTTYFRSIHSTFFFFHLVPFKAYCYRVLSLQLSHPKKNAWLLSVNIFLCTFITLLLLSSTFIISIKFFFSFSKSLFRFIPGLDEYHTYLISFHWIRIAGRIALCEVKVKHDSSQFQYSSRPNVYSTRRLKRVSNPFFPAYNFRSYLCIQMLLSFWNFVPDKEFSAIDIDFLWWSVYSLSCFSTWHHQWNSSPATLERRSTYNGSGNAGYRANQLGEVARGAFL